MRRTLIELGVGSHEGAFWFYSRVAGQKEPERKHLIKFSEDFVGRQRQNNIAKVGTIGTGGNPSSSAGASTLTGNVMIAPTAASGTASRAGIQSASGSARKNPPTDLSQFCFVGNRLLLETQLFPPSDEIARLLKCFHELSNYHQLQAAASLELIFKGQPSPGTSPDWMLKLAQLPEQDLHVAALWFSRYCDQPAKTYSQIHKILQSSALKASSTPQSSSAQSQDPSLNEQSRSQGSHWFCRKIKSLFSKTVH